MNKFLILAILGLSLSGISAQTTQPAAMDRGTLEIAANAQFNKGQYALALPMLKKLRDLSQDQHDLVGPIEEKIRVCERNLGPDAAAAAVAAAAAAAQAPAPQQPSLSENRVPHKLPKDGELMQMEIKELGNFDYDSEHGGNIPDDVVKLSGHKIKLQGYMIPMDQAANITQFALVPSLFSCCFGQPPQIQHTIVVNCPKGKAVSYYPDEISVEGTLTVAEKKDEGFIVSIFEVEVSSVKPVAK